MLMNLFYVAFPLYIDQMAKAITILVEKLDFHFCQTQGDNLNHHFINLFKSFVCINLNGEKFNFKEEYFKTLFC